MQRTSISKTNGWLFRTHSKTKQPEWEWKTKKYCFECQYSDKNIIIMKQPLFFIAGHLPFASCEWTKCSYANRVEKSHSWSNFWWKSEVSKYFYSHAWIRDGSYNTLSCCFFFIQASGRYINLTIQDGADILGNLVEASDLSLNKKYYGSLHSDLHLFTSMAQNPDDHFTKGFMGDTSTAMRDPAFYRVHAFVDYIYNAFKETLPPYTRTEVCVYFPSKYTWVCTCILEKNAVHQKLVLFDL